jgi:hypothetical protein
VGHVVEDEIAELVSGTCERVRDVRVEAFEPRRRSRAGDPEVE